MATDTFTYDAVRTKTPRVYKNTKKNYKSFKLDKSNVVGMGTTAVKPYLSRCSVGSRLVWFATYCGKMHSCHLCSYGTTGGLSQSRESRDNLVRQVA